MPKKPNPKKNMRLLAELPELIQVVATRSDNEAIQRIQSLRAHCGGDEALLGVFVSSILHSLPMLTDVREQGWLTKELVPQLREACGDLSHPLIFKNG